MRDYIEINKELIPYTFDISLADEIFTLEIKYNTTVDLFTVGLYKEGELICAGEPIIYGQPLFSDLFINGKYPELTIIPLDESENANAVTYDNLNETVYLVVDNGE